MCAKVTGPACVAPGLVALSVTAAVYVQVRVLVCVVPCSVQSCAAGLVLVCAAALAQAQTQVSASVRASAIEPMVWASGSACASSGSASVDAFSRAQLLVHQMAQA